MKKNCKLLFLTMLKLRKVLAVLSNEINMEKKPPHVYYSAI